MYWWVTSNTPECSSSLTPAFLGRTFTTWDWLSLTKKKLNFTFLMKFPTPECSDSGRTFTSLELKKLLLFLIKAKTFLFWRAWERTLTSLWIFYKQMAKKLLKPMECLGVRNSSRKQKKDKVSLDFRYQNKGTRWSECLGVLNSSRSVFPTSVWKTTSRFGDLRRNETQKK